jgi:hypothetical protein
MTNPNRDASSGLNINPNVSSGLNMNLAKQTFLVFTHLQGDA